MTLFNNCRHLSSELFLTNFWLATAHHRYHHSLARTKHRHRLVTKAVLHNQPTLWNLGHERDSSRCRNVFKMLPSGNMSSYGIQFGFHLAPAHLDRSSAILIFAAAFFEKVTFTLSELTSWNHALHTAACTLMQEKFLGTDHVLRAKPTTSLNRLTFTVSGSARFITWAFSFDVRVSDAKANLNRPFLNNLHNLPVVSHARLFFFNRAFTNCRIDKHTRWLWPNVTFCCTSRHTQLTTFLMQKLIITSAKAFTTSAENFFF